MSVFNQTQTPVLTWLPLWPEDSMESPGYSGRRDSQAGRRMVARNFRTRNGAFDAGHGICQQQILLYKAGYRVKINTVLSHYQPDRLRSGYPNGASSLCNEPVWLPIGRCMLPLLLSGGNLGTLPQLWVVQLLLFLRQAQMATSTQRAASQLIPCLNVP